jgi:D-aminopeptidase
MRRLTALPESAMDPLFRSVVQATDEAIVNCLVAAETMEGVEHHRVEELPEDRVVAILKQHRRLG